MSRTYHHGSLRTALLEEGQTVLREQGVQAVTLRELARRTGVSHAAPQRHFADREALLEALAAEGFDALTRVLEVADGAGDLGERLSAYAHAHVRFALDNGALMELMFSRRLAQAKDGPAARAAGRFFALGARMLGERTTGPMGPMPYVLTGAIEGISSLAATGRLPRERVEEVTTTAVQSLLPAIQRQWDHPPG